MKKPSLILVQIFLLWLIYLIGEELVQLLHIPLPGNVVGMLLLFWLLKAGIIEEEWVDNGAGLLLKHLGFFFVPIAVGLMEWGNLFLAKGWWLFLVLTLSALVALGITGGFVQIYDRQEEKGHG